MGCANTGPIAPLGCTELSLTLINKIAEENMEEKISYQIVRKYVTLKALTLIQEMKVSD